MDFIEKLPSSSRFNTILVIVNQLTKQTIFISAYDTIMSTDLACLFVLHVFFKHGISSYVTSNRSLEFMSNFFQSLGTAFDIQLHFTSGYHPKVMNKPNAQIRLSNNTSIYIITTSKITSPNFYLSQSLPTIMLQVLLLVFLHSLLIRDIIQTSLFIPNAILLPPEPATSPQISMNYEVLSKLKSPRPNSIIRNPLMGNIPLLLISKQVTKFLSKAKFFQTTHVKIAESELSFLLFSFSFLFYFRFIFHLSIFRTLGLGFKVICHTVTSVTSDGMVTTLITEL